MKRQRLGLALGGGAALGWAHIGVIRGLEENNIHADVVAGTSIGAVVGACLAAGKLDELEDIVRAVRLGDILRFADLNLTRGGILGGRGIENELRRHFGHAQIGDLSKPFAAVATDLITGSGVVIREGPVVQAIRASIALPGIFPPVARGEALLADGGLVDPVPVEACRQLGASRVVAVNVQADYRSRAQRSGLTSGRDLPIAAGVRIARASIGLLLRSLAAARLQVSVPDALIQPRTGHVDVVNFTRARELIFEGRRAAEEALPEIRALLEAESV